MSRIFIIGATGHIGGAVLEEIAKSHPTAEVSVLVRDRLKAKHLVEQYNDLNLTTIIGGLESIDVIENAAKEARIVINTAPDIIHEAGIAAIVRGLEARSEKGYYIHTSGAAIT
ncbi:MAG: hypothetical protein M1834_000079 [Cirrosporium novae-zelandiae]|nr:MAG: hypothetical protein M1834_000079 [Cirrosporium novae-zelandiae]